MKNRIGIFCMLVFALLGAQAQQAASSVAKQVIEIVSGNLKLTLMVGSDNRLYQLGFGDAEKKILLPSVLPSREQEFLPPYGNGVNGISYPSYSYGWKYFDGITLCEP